MLVSLGIWAFGTDERRSIGNEFSAHDYSGELSGMKVRVLLNLMTPGQWKTNAAQCDSFAYFGFKFEPLNK